MKLVALTLNYFRQYRGVTVSFVDGLTGIIGPNGSGKTTLLEGIAFALFGSRALRGKVDDVLTRGAPKGKSAEAILAFEHEGQVFRVERRGGEAALYQGGESAPLASGPREVSQVISSVLRMSQEEFFATYFTEQKGLEFLSGQKGAAERERFIVRLLGYDRFEKVQDALRAERRELRAEVMGREAAVGSKEALEARLEAEQSELVLLEEALKEAAAALERASDTASRAKKDYLKIEGQREQHHGLQAELRELEARLAERTQGMKERRARVEALQAERAMRVAELIASGILDSRQRSAAEWCAELGERRAALEDQADTQDKAVQTTEAEWRKVQSEKLAELRLCEDRVKSQEQKLRKLKDLAEQGICPTCRQKMGPAFKEILEEEERELGGAELRLKAAKEACGAAAHEPEALREARGLQTEVRKRALAAKELERKAEEYARIEAELERSEASVKSYETETMQLTERLNVVKERCAASPYAEDAYLRLKGGYEAAQGLESAARLKRVKVEGELTTKQGLLSRTKEELMSFEQRMRELEARKARLVILDEGDTFLTDFRSYVNGTIRPRLAELASEFITELTDGRYTTVEVEKDFSPTVVEDGERKAVISGGEEDILNLCMRFALSQMLAERAGHAFSLLIMDEVFGSLDEQRRMNVLHLMEKLSERFEQIIIVTHLDDIKEGVRHLYYVDFDEASAEATVRASTLGAAVDRSSPYEAELQIDEAV
jgi:exonuclease SbcC